MVFRTDLNQTEINQLTPGQLRLRQLVQDNMGEYYRVHSYGRHDQRYIEFCRKFLKQLNSEDIISQDWVTGRSLLVDRVYAKTLYSYFELEGSVVNIKNHTLKLDFSSLGNVDYDRYERGGVYDWSAYYFAGIGVDFMGLYFKVMSNQIKLDKLNFKVSRYLDLNSYRFISGNHRGIALSLLRETKEIEVEDYNEYHLQHTLPLDTLRDFNTSLLKIESKCPNLKLWSRGIQIDGVIDFAKNMSDQFYSEDHFISDVIS